MQRCLGNLVNDSLLIYLDDVVVFSPDFNSHLRHLEVFQCLYNHGLKLQPAKCHLFQRNVTYLGHVISEHGVATDPVKTAAVRDWPIPQTVKQVKIITHWFIPTLPILVLWNSGGWPSWQTSSMSSNTDQVPKIKMQMLSSGYQNHRTQCHPLPGG